jgi:hypothetical protein
MSCMSRLLWIPMILMLLVSCSKETEEISATPEITFETISPGTVKEFADSVVIQLTYTDGDGDLGENGSGIENAFITDSRNNLMYTFRIRQLAPDNANVIIRGKLSIVVPAVALVNSTSTSETATFEVYIKDRAGHQSNTITTSSVTVVP